LHLPPLHAGGAAPGVPPRVSLVRHRTLAGRALARVVRVQDRARQGVMVDGRTRGDRSNGCEGAAARQRRGRDDDCGRRPAAAHLDRGRPRPECLRHRHGPAALPRRGDPGAARPLHPRRAARRDRPRARPREEPRRTPHDHAGGAGGGGGTDARRSEPHVPAGRRVARRRAQGQPARPRPPPGLDRLVDPGADHRPAARARREPQTGIPGGRDERAIHPQPARARERPAENRGGRAADPIVRSAAQHHAREHGIADAQVQARVARYIDEIVPQLNVLSYYKIGYNLAKLVLNLLYRVTVDYQDEAALERIPKKDVVVYVMNHRSNVDYVVVAYILAYGA